MPFAEPNAISEFHRGRGEETGDFPPQAKFPSPKNCQFNCFKVTIAVTLKHDPVVILSNNSVKLFLIFFETFNGNFLAIEDGKTFQFY